MFSQQRACVERASGCGLPLFTELLRETEWACIEPHIPTSKGAGRARLHPLREVLNATVYIFWLRIPTNGLGGPFLRWLYAHLLPHL